MTLREATRDLHHACEQHPLGQRMARGEVTAQEWADWLAGFAVLHAAADRVMPIHMQRGYLFNADFEWLRMQHGVEPREPQAAVAWASMLDTETDKLGAAYVLHGAHRRGGPIIRKVVSRHGLPSAHTHYDRAVDAERLVKALSARTDLAAAARRTFAVLLASMDEVSACRG